MKNIESIFFEEAGELIHMLERELLTLEKDPTNKESIGSIFRAMHTLKGSAGMFGMDAIRSITHNLETIYESIRDNKKQLNSEILTVTLRSLDHLKRILADPKLLHADLKRDHEILLKEIERITEGTESIVSSQITPDAEPSDQVFYISFYPHPETLLKGTNTLYVLDDLLSLGNGICLPFIDHLPSFEDINPKLSVLGFEIILRTSKSEKTIQETFLFVEDESEISIQKIDTENAFDPETIKHNLSTANTNHRKIGFEKINSLRQATQAVPNSQSTTTQSLKNVSNVRVSSTRLDELMNLVSELVTMQAGLSLYAEKMDSPELISITENIEKITRRLRDNAFMMSLIPIESLTIRFERLVRDLSKELKKEVKVKKEGTETEIDKSIIEKITDPLLHILRNSLDHGIETPEERIKKGKPREGTISLKAYYSGANVIIEIGDDGAGINLEKVRQKAFSKKLITDETLISDKDLLNLIFSPGFSTADQVTDVSGRGVGMDVVQRNINELRGDIEVATRKNEGTTFIIRLPLTLSIIDGLLVRIGETDFILPFSSVYKCYEVETENLEKTFNQWITLDGNRTPFLFLRKEFNIHQASPKLSQVIKVSHEGSDIGLAVDRIIGEYQAVLKPLGHHYREHDEFSGATILGDGSVALVLDPYKLIKKIIYNPHPN